MTMHYAPDLFTGCDYWTGARYCAREAPYEDEITTQVFCVEHAGPLAMSGHDVDVYSLALKLHGLMGTTCPLPATQPDRRTGAA